MKRRKLLLAFLLLGAGSAWAQEPARVLGMVTSEAGQPIAGVNVVVLGTGRGALTDAEGRYVVTGVPAGTYQVVASLIGYSEVTQQVTVAAGETATLNFRLEREAIQLEGIVAVGYGTLNRRHLTGSVASIRSDAITQVVTANPVDALKGRLPGVDITAASFEPGAYARVRIRGARSIRASNDPLIVVDGVPISGDLRDVDANDIQSIEVLKDAAASAIYGSRAANGVLLVTTKKGIPGRTRIDYSTTFGASRILRKPDLMNGEEFANYRREAYRAAGNAACADYISNPAPCDAVALDALMRANLAAGVSTDWQDEILRTGQLQDHHLAISGGNENTRFRASFGYLDQTGITITQGYNAKTGSVTLAHDFGRLNVQATVQATQTLRIAGRGAGVWDEALFNSPLGRARDESGKLVFLPTEDGLRVNPIMDARENRRDIKRTRVFGTASASLELLDGVKLVTNFGPEYSLVEDGWFVGRYTREKRGAGAPDAGLDNTRRTSYTLSNYLEIDRLIGERHRIQGALVYEISHNEMVWDSAAAKELPYSHQLWYDLGSGKDYKILSRFEESSRQAYIARINYTLNDRYIFSISGSVEGSSVLAEGHKYAFFPGAGFAWQIGDEPFMQNVPVFSDLKLRLTYGSVGNSAIGPYQTLGRLAGVWYNFGASAPQVLGYEPGSIPNPELKWERTDKYNLGLDFGLFDNRLTGAIDAYLEKTYDLLLPRALPYTSGYSSVLQNIGKTQNKGIEIALSSLNLSGWNGIDWETDLSFSLNRNKIIALASGLTQDIGSGWFVGQPINVNYNYKFLGIWQTDEAAEAAAMGFKPGEVKVADLNGDGKITGDDRTFIGNHVNFPDWQGSINNRLRYRNFDLSVLVTARWGYMVNNAFILAYGSLAGRFNNLDVDYWTPEKPSNKFPRPNVNGQGNYFGALALQDGSHVRVRDITLGYTLPGSMLQRIGARHARLYVRAQEPFLFTKSDFVGWDPEAGFSSGDGNFTFSQIDSGSPAYRSILFGVDLGF